MSVRQPKSKSKPRRPQYAGSPINLTPAIGVDDAWAYEDEKGISIYADMELDSGPYVCHRAHIGLISWAQIEKCLTHHKAVEHGRKK